MEKIKVISVAGLMVSEGDPDVLAHELKKNPFFTEQAEVRTVYPTPRSLAGECPLVAANRTLAMVEKIMAEGEKNQPLHLVGRSYGGNMALLAAISFMRREMKNFLGVTLIESPLHPEKKVTRPVFFPILWPCFAHYNQRSQLMNRAAQDLAELGTAQITIVQAGANDKIVPNAAQILPGEFDFFTPDDCTDLENIPAENNRGVIIRLPEKAAAKPWSWKRIFPSSYRNHLLAYANAEKKAWLTAIVMNSIRRLLARRSS